MDVPTSVSFVWSGSWDPAALAIAHRTLRVASSPVASKEVLAALAVVSSKLACIQRRTKFANDCLRINEHLRGETPALQLWSAGAAEVCAAAAPTDPANRMQHAVRMLQVRIIDRAGKKVEGGGRHKPPKTPTFAYTVISTGGRSFGAIPNQGRPHPFLTPPKSSPSLTECSPDITRA